MITCVAKRETVATVELHQIQASKPPNTSTQEAQKSERNEENSALFQAACNHLHRQIACAPIKHGSTKEEGSSTRSNHTENLETNELATKAERCSVSHTPDAEEKLQRQTVGFTIQVHFELTQHKRSEQD